MKKLMLVAAMLALALVVAVPAMAQLASGVGQSPDSGDVALGFDVANKGNYASQCTPAIQFGNTGNFDNGSSFVQYDGEIDDFEPGGIEVGFGGSNSTACPSTI